MAELLSMHEPRTRVAAMICGLDIRYDLGDAPALLGRRMPDLDLRTAEGPTRVFTLLHQARGVLVTFGQRWAFDVSPWAHRVSVVDAEHTGKWELPAIGEISAPDAVLIRPDGYVAWVGHGTATGLREALNSWFA